MTVTTILVGHVSPETAYLVEDYPYGFRLRCKIRYWLEFKPGFGVRFVSQTTNPKRGDVWNMPKASTYGRFGGSMFLDENEHVCWSALTEYVDDSEALAWCEQYGAGVPAGAATDAMHRWVNTKVFYERFKTEGKSIHEAASLAMTAVAKGETP